MILNKDFEKMLNTQYTNEISSALLYKNISGYYADRYFDGIATFFNNKYKEELEHAEKFYEYIMNRDGRPIIYDIKDYDLDFDESDIIKPFYLSLEHEQEVTEYIYRLFQKSRELNDYTSEQFLSWFVTEQAEEEQEFLNYIARLELIKNSGEGLYRFNDMLVHHD